MPRIFHYDNDFDNTDGDGDNLDGATFQTTSDATHVGVRNTRLSDDSDNELVFFNTQGQHTDAQTYEGAILDLNAGLTDEERVKTLTASMQLDMHELEEDFHGGPGNKQPDGISFSFGDLSTYKQHGNSNNKFDYEQGVSEGLSVRIIPHSGHQSGRGTLQITWNGKVIGSTDFTGSGIHDSTAVSSNEVEFKISVSETGAVSASLGKFSVSATIPNGEWTTADQDGWDFAVAGRSGSAGGTGHIDDLKVEAQIICFARGTQIDTPVGPVAVENLKAGDQVMTFDNGPQYIRWTGARKLTAPVLRDHPHLRPIRIAAGALGAGRPAMDLVVSPQHRIFLDSIIAQRMFGTHEVLVAAKQLLVLPGIEVDETCREVEYIHFLCDRHELVWSNDALTESLYTGAEALKSIGSAASSEIFELFPELKHREQPPEPARLLVRGSMARKLAQRHVANKKPLCLNAKASRL